MITSLKELELTQSQIARVERALADLRRDVLPVNPEQYELMAEGYVEMWRKLRSEVDAFLGVAVDSHAAT